MRIDVFQPKRRVQGDPAKLGSGDLTVVGQIRQVVFTPRGDRVVGFLVRRPDVAGMIRREDAFLALDSFVVGQYGLIATRGDDSFDDAARERLGIDWDSCLIWTGMDAKTTDGKELGWVDDVSFSPKDGRVQSFYVGDGSVAKSLVGNVVIPGEMLRGYKDGYLLVDPKAATLSLDGGLAAKAGEGYARAKQSGKKAVEQAGKVAGSAVEKGAYGLGRAIGKAKKNMTQNKDESQKQSSTRKGKKKRNMFGAFMDEYKKASR